MPIAELLNLTETLSEEELKAIMLAALRGSGPLTTPQLEDICRWAHDVRTAAVILESIIAGDLMLQWREGLGPLIKVAADHPKEPMN